MVMLAFLQGGAQVQKGFFADDFGRRLVSRRPRKTADAVLLTRPFRNFIWPTSLRLSHVGQRVISAAVNRDVERFVQFRQNWQRQSLGDFLELGMYFFRSRTSKPVPTFPQISIFTFCHIKPRTASQNVGGCLPDRRKPPDANSAPDQL